ncbi:hypothetical protein NQ176_g5076 [Zarea fungicola]|uniref:Uncharacterized protein n=1 Tax=Zarea fungicola TaxID=93591 RepID=A0ACC1NAY9_9HYPO|nr:hypothetical protein NQ176_g5076 [Lecanicillium fungicola]
MAPVLDAPQTVDWMGKKVPVWSMQTINYGLLLSQDPSEVDKVVNACLEDGYFYLDLQGIDGRRMLADRQDTLKLMKRFFDAPIEAKNEFGLISSHLGYEPVGSRTGVAAGSKDGYEMLKVSRDEIQRDSPKIPSPVKNSGDLQILENAIGSCNTVTKVILSALSTGLGLSGAARFENSHRNERPSTTTLSMMHYLPTELAGENRIGHQKHTDISTLTLLFSEQWGLQVRPPGTCGAREMGFVAPKPGLACLRCSTAGCSQARLPRTSSVYSDAFDLTTLTQAIIHEQQEQQTHIIAALEWEISQLRCDLRELRVVTDRIRKMLRDMADSATSISQLLMAAQKQCEIERRKRLANFAVI